MAQTIKAQYEQSRSNPYYMGTINLGGAGTTNPTGTNIPPVNPTGTPAGQAYNPITNSYQPAPTITPEQQAANYASQNANTTANSYNLNDYVYNNEPTLSQRLASSEALYSGVPQESEATRALKTNIDDTIRQLKQAREFRRGKIAKDYENLQGQQRVAAARSGYSQASSAAQQEGISGEETAQQAAADMDLINAMNQQQDRLNTSITGDTNRYDNLRNQYRTEALSYESQLLADKKAKLAQLGSIFFARGVDPKNVSEEDLKKIAQSYGLSGSIQQITKAFEDAKKASEAERLKQEKEGQVSLGEGQALYDRAGKLIAKNPKTTTAETSTSGGVGSGSLYGTDRSGSNAGSGGYLDTGVPKIVDPGTISLAEGYVKADKEVPASIAKTPQGRQIAIAIRQIQRENGIRDANQLKTVVDSLVAEAEEGLQSDGTLKSWGISGDNSGFSNAVGGIQGNPYLPTIRSSTRVVDNLFNQFKNLTTAQNIKNFAFLRPFSDTDRRTVEGAGSVINQFNDEQELYKQLKNIQGAISRSIDETRGETPRGGVDNTVGPSFVYPANKQQEITPEELQELKDAGYDVSQYE